MNYPSPCEKCDTGCGRSGTRYANCPQYHTWINTWWKHFNVQYRKLCQSRQTISHKYLYEHPDTIRRYLHNGPCAGCKAAESCDTPCPAYWRWWDARMEWMRRRVGL